jgi:hypothetical protein
MNLYIHEKGRTSGPFDETEVKAGLLSNRWGPITLVCFLGETQWRPLNQVIELPSEPALPPPPPSPSSISLWNPWAVAAWSIILTPAFGAFLHAKNWISLGQLSRARISEQWAWGVMIIFGVLFYHASEGSGKIVGVFWILGLVAWINLDAKAQIAFVNDRFGESYQRSNWLVPLLVGIPAVLLYKGLFSYLFTQRLAR